MEVPTSFGLPFFFRYIVPGLFTSIAALPLIPSLYRPRAGLDAIAWFLLIVVVAGLVLRGFFRAHVAFLTGAYGPAFYRRLGIRNLRRKLAAAIETERKAEGVTTIDWESKETWAIIRAKDFVRRFPPDAQGKPQVAAPTIFGNIYLRLVGRLAQALPLGQWQGFFITQVWADLSPELRRDVHETLAPAEAALSSSLGLSMLIPFYLTMLGLTTAGITHDGPQLTHLVLAGLVSALAAYVGYRIAVAEAQTGFQLIENFVLRGVYSQQMALDFQATQQGTSHEAPAQPSAQSPRDAT